MDWYTVIVGVVCFVSGLSVAVMLAALAVGGEADREAGDSRRAERAARTHSTHTENNTNTQSR